MFFRGTEFGINMDPLVKLDHQLSQQDVQRTEDRHGENSDDDEEAGVSSRMKHLPGCSFFKQMIGDPGLSMCADAQPAGRPPTT